MNNDQTAKPSEREAISSELHATSNVAPQSVSLKTTPCQRCRRPVSDSECPHCGYGKDAGPMTDLQFPETGLITTGQQTESAENACSGSSLQTAEELLRDVFQEPRLSSRPIELDLRDALENWAAQIRSEEAEKSRELAHIVEFFVKREWEEYGVKSARKATIRIGRRTLDRARAALTKYKENPQNHVK